ncbi:transporter substrate-binding domain-containing protein [Prolixibacter bellariivorans]|uniref:transporter substrate-binding domain-containing protein n=1 Tax=Prolixibacter bellariivorans TaxID=314319 RepID=UPI00048147EE|nr:transporter substrate-binding domain-containing protein [Prolixibacter bellariivorans]
MRIRRYIFLLFAVFSLLVISCEQATAPTRADDDHIPQKTNELDRVLKDGKLKAVVDYNSTNYFVYRGRPMGFQYELLKALAKNMGVTLEINVRNNLEETFNDLNAGRVDLVAKNLTITKERNQIVSFTYPLGQTRQVLVQRKPKDWRQMTEEQIDQHLVRNQLDLAGKTVYVQQNTAYAERMRSLSDEIGAEINLKEDSVYGVEQLVAMVAEGKIDYTVCDENVGKVNEGYYPNLDVKTPVSFPQYLAWAVRKNAPSLKKYIDKWIKDFRKTDDYRKLYNKYFRNPRTASIVQSNYYSLNGNQLSRYDSIIKVDSRKIHWDWRLVASIIYQESRFDPHAESWAGAVGLMQLMPETAEWFNVDDMMDPKQNIYGGTQMLSWLDNYFSDDIPDKTERLKFVLASYNVGLGHVLDARRLARKYGKDPNIWDGNVDYFLLHKSVAKYYKDPLVKWGYCRGEEPYKYVKEVWERYLHYRNLVKES